METVYGHLASYLRRAGHEVTMLHGGSRLKQVGDGAWVIPLEILRTWHRLPRPDSLLRGGQNLRGLYGLLRELRPDVVHVHFVGAEALYFIALRRVLGFRVVVTAHGSDIRRHYNPVSRFVQPYVLRLADEVTAVSSALAEQIRSKSGREAHVIPNGVDLDFWDGPPRHGASTNPEIVSVGRLEAVKGHDVLLQALPGVLHRVPGARLVLIGNGSRRESLVRLASDLGVDGHVEFAGALKPEAIRSRYGGANVFVLPSRGEGMPMALLEAMANGLPIVATAVGAVPELLEGGAGLLVSPDDPVALADALVQVLAQPDLARNLAQEARYRVQDQSWSETARKYEMLLTGRLSETMPVAATLHTAA